MSRGGVSVVNFVGASSSPASGREREKRSWPASAFKRVRSMSWP
jgi:hypothetical protein